MKEKVEIVTTNLQTAISALNQAVDAIENAAEDIEDLDFYNADGISVGLSDTANTLRITAEQITSTKNIVIEGTR
jgi:hypothetical protein